MVELVSHYVMPGEKESETEELIRSLGLDGIENLVYGTTPSETPFTKLSVGAHLKFWPDWVDFYIGNREEYKKESSAEGTHIPFCGADTPEGWLEEIRKNIRAALAEKPAYLVWHVANCRIEEAWTGKFRYSSKEVLDLTAEIYKKVKGEVPPDVEVLFENIFWPGLSALTPEELDYFFSRLPYDNVGVMLDTGHYMNTVPDVETEKDGADAVVKMLRNLREMKKLIRGIHLSCSLSGVYRRTFDRTPPKEMTEEVIMKHITTIDQHRPFATDAALRIAEAAEPEFLNHELFGPHGEIPPDAVKMQRRALGKKI